MGRALVTGGAGFIGSNFVNYWLETRPGARVVVLDALTYAGNPANLAHLANRPEYRFVHGDIGDTALVESLLRAEQLDTIVHFAAESHVDRSIVSPDAFIQTNVIGTHSLLRAARKVWLEEKLTSRHRFHHVSTDEVYGSLGPTDPAFSESTPYAPNSPYAASKAASDHLARAYHHTYGLEVSISNCSNNYGPYHFPEKLIPLMIVNILHGRDLPVYGDGLNVRDWLHVTDHCRAIGMILDAGQAVGRVYNVGGNSECTNIELVKMLCEIADGAFARHPELKSAFPDASAAQGRRSESLIRFVKDRPGHDRRYAIDATRLQRELAFAPSVRLKEGLEATFQWYVTHGPWWRDVMNGQYRQWLQTNYADRA